MKIEKLNWLQEALDEDSKFRSEFDNFVKEAKWMENLNDTYVTNKLITLKYLLEEEVAALRSVLCEWDHDKDCFLQMKKADRLREAFESLDL